MLFQSLPHVQFEPVLAMLVGARAAALVALVVALPLMRLTGLVAGLATFALLNIVYIVARNLNDVTGGSTGLASVPVSTTPWTAGLWSIVAVVLVWLFGRTTLCLRLRSSREDEAASRATGVGVTGERTAAFVLSAFVAGLSGGLFAQFFGSFNPEAFFLKATFLSVAMLVVGGALSLSGAVFGALFIAVVTELLRRAEKGFSIGGLDVASRPGLQELGVVGGDAPRPVAPARRVDRWTRGRPAELAGPPAATARRARQRGALDPADRGAGVTPSTLAGSGLRVHFEGVKAVDEVDIDVSAGETLGLIGPNGAGKTTLLNALSGFQRPTAGTITIDGHDITRMPAARRSRAGVVRTFQAIRVFRRLSVFENVELGGIGGGLRRAAARQRAAQLIDEARIEALAGRPAGELSHGDQRLLGILRALAMRAEVPPPR